MLMTLKMGHFIVLVLFPSVSRFDYSFKGCRTGNSWPFQINLLTWRNFSDGMCRCTFEYGCSKCLVPCQL